jgi:hypothetical protein
MTLPEQSDRAVAQTREFLVRLASPYVEGGIKGIRREVRAEALRLLRHYPYSWNSDCPESDNAANADNTPATHATPSEGIEQNGCALTDWERDAIESAIWDYSQNDDDEDCARMVATLESLLERME